MGRFPPVRRLAALLLCGTVLLAACRTKSDPEPPTTTSVLPVTTQPTPATTATTVDVSAPPTPAQLQDPAYWKAVLAALNHVAAEAFRSAARARAVEPSAVEALRQVYGDEVFPNQQRSLTEIAAGRDKGLLIPPGDPRADITGIVRAATSCVGLTASVDYSAVNPNIPVSPVVIELRPFARTTSMVNPTPWKIERQFVMADPNDTSLLCSG